MRKLADRLRADTKVDPRLQLMFIGVATDWEFDKGLRFLADYGAFDEVIVGGNWLNSAAVRFIWRDLPGQPAFPQVVLLEREVTVNKTNVTFGPEKVISRFIGIDEIIERVDSEQKLLPRRTTTF